MVGFCLDEDRLSSTERPIGTIASNRDHRDTRIKHGFKMTRRSNPIVNCLGCRGLSFRCVLASSAAHKEMAHTSHSLLLVVCDCIIVHNLIENNRASTIASAELVQFDNVTDLDACTGRRRIRDGTAPGRTRQGGLRGRIGPRRGRDVGTKLVAFVLIGRRDRGRRVGPEGLVGLIRLIRSARLGRTEPPAEQTAPEKTTTSLDIRGKHRDRKSTEKQSLFHHEILFVN